MSAATPEQHTTSLSVDEVAWDLETLLPVPGKNGVLQLLDEAAAEAEILTQARGTLGSMTVSDFASFVDSLASLTDKLGRAGNYAMLQFTVDTDSPEVGALMQQTQERSTAIGSQLIFVEIELSELPDSKAEEFIADPRLSQVSHHLENLRRYRPFLLTEPEEIILSEKSVTGAAAWSRLWDEQSSAIRCELGDESVSLENCLAQLESPDSATRRAAFEAITGGLAPGIRTRGYIYNTLSSKPLK